MSQLYLSRLSLQRDASLTALAPLLLPAGQGPCMGGAHRLLWAAFADSPDRKRDFLWRQDDKHRWFVLSERPPHDPHRLFKIESKTFTPVLNQNDRLSFVLRANAVVTRKEGGRPKRSDVVMDRLRAIPRGQRAPQRDDLAFAAGSDWLAQQGTKWGFRPDPGRQKISYETPTIPRDGRAPIELGLLDFAGELTVEEPERFLQALARGFGKAKGFGCGLMLIRRA